MHLIQAIIFVVWPNEKSRKNCNLETQLLSTERMDEIASVHIGSFFSYPGSPVNQTKIGLKEDPQVILQKILPMGKRFGRLGLTGVTLVNSFEVAPYAVSTFKCSPTVFFQHVGDFQSFKRQEWEGWAMSFLLDAPLSAFAGCHGLVKMHANCSSLKLRPYKKCYFC